MLEVVRYTEDMSACWDQAIMDSVNGTFLNTRRYGLHCPNRFRDHGLLFRDPEILAVVPAAEVEMERGPALVSHPGATYGGIVLKAAPKLRKVVEVVESLEAYAARNGFRSIVLKQTPYIFHSAPCETVPYVLAQRGYALAAVELTSALELAAVDPANVLATFDGKTRNQCRLGERAGLVFGRSAEFEEFHRLLVTSLEGHHAQPVHSAPELREIARLCEEAALYTVTQNGSILAGCFAFGFRKSVFHTQYLASDRAANSLAPMNYLIWKLIETAKTSGFRYFNFGKSTEDGGRVPNMGLFKFKEGFGASGVLLTTHRKDLP